MACFPALAQAEEGNAGIQYETEVPTVPTHESSNIPSAGGGNGGVAEASNSPRGGGNGGHGSKKDGAHTGQGSQGSGGGEGKAADGGGNAKSGLANGRPLSLGEAAGESSGASSPLVPILVAIAALAAISLGAFLYRQRRQRAGSPVSPKAS